MGTSTDYSQEAQRLRKVAEGAASETLRGGFLGLANGYESLARVSAVIRSIAPNSPTAPWAPDQRR